MSENKVQQAGVDLSDAGVEKILAALANAGIEVHYNETDGDCYIDIWLTDFDAAPIDILSWRDSRGWWLAEWDSNDTNGSPDREWTVFGATPADVARDVAAILDATPSEAPDAIAIDPVAGAELAAKVQAEVELSPQTRALVAQIEAAAPRQNTDEFTRIREGLFDAQVCTSLSDDEATARMNEVPSGTSGGWQLATDPYLAPVPCADRPDTHRHLIFEA